jgi:hypothetical protein
MPISRRLFIKSGTLTAVAASVAFSPSARAFGQRRTPSNSLGYQIPITAQQEPMFMFTHATFDPYVGSIFQAPNARGQMIDLTLVSVTQYKASPRTKISTAPAPATDSFSLMFKAAGPLPPFTSIHNISHPSLGKFYLFLTVHSKAGEALMYEAVFNHI